MGGLADKITELKYGLRFLNLISIDIMNYDFYKTKDTSETDKILHKLIKQNTEIIPFLEEIYKKYYPKQKSS